VDSELSFEEVVRTTRAVRRLSPDPVPPEKLRRLVEIAALATNSANEQTWGFVIVTDEAQRARLGALYLEIAARSVRLIAEGERPARDADQLRVYRNTWNFARRFAEVPALIACCARGSRPTDPSWLAAWYGSIFPAVQNLMLAARARGLGSVLTTLHLRQEARAKQILELPDDVNPEALVALGYPLFPFKGPKRRPASEVTHWNRWGGSQELPPGGSEELPPGDSEELPPGDSE
jgi:nitroreductase